MPTDAQLRANRQNAKKSTGPRTPEGKATTSQNATRHGLLSATPSFPGEDPAEFEAFLRSTTTDLQPQGAVQQSLATRIAHLQWKLQRIPHLEAALITNLAGDEQATRDEDWRDEEESAAADRRPICTAQMIVADFVRPDSVLAKFQLYEQRLERSLKTCLKDFRDLQKEQGDREEEKENVATKVADDLSRNAPNHSPVSAISVAVCDEAPADENQMNKRTQTIDACQAPQGTPVDIRPHPILLPEGEGTGNHLNNRSQSGNACRTQESTTVDVRPHANLVPAGEGTGTYSYKQSQYETPTTALSLPSGQSRSEGERRTT